jgi:hypothetical protein
MQQHQQTLPDPVALIVTRPQAGPLTQDVRRPSGTSADRLIHPELNLDHAIIGLAEHLGEELRIPAMHAHLRERLEATLTPVENPRRVRA